MVLGVSVFLVLCSVLSSFAQHNKYIAIKGGTLIDLTNKGNSSNDLKEALVLIQDDKVSYAGPKTNIQIPADAKIIDATGKFIIPGLIDGFAALNNQAYANAYLYMGVTSIIAVSGGRRGELFRDGIPSPTIFELGDVGYERTSDEELLKQIDRMAAENVKILLLMYKLKPNQLKLAVNKAKQLGFGIIGELGYSSYADGISAGIDAFVHSTRYSLDIAPKNLRESVAENPFSDDLNSPKWQYYKYLTNINIDDDKKLSEHASRLGNYEIFIMPTLSLLYLDIPDHKNPWEQPVAKIIDPMDVNNPANQITGKHDYDNDLQQAYTALITNIMKIEELYNQSGASYLAGSATDVWGTMPGISLHTELELLSKIGLTNRQAIAAATTNFSVAFGWKTIGQVKKGCFADILVLDKNPLENLENLKQINMLFHRGKEIDLSKLIN